MNRSAIANSVTTAMRKILAYCFQKHLNYLNPRAIANSDITAMCNQVENNAPSMNLVSNQSCFDSGGWVGFKTMVVTQKIKETDDITSFIIQNLNGEPLPDFKPGNL